jgi:hypothetical protein
MIHKPLDEKNEIINALITQNGTIVNKKKIIEKQIKKISVLKKTDKNFLLFSKDYKKMIKFISFPFAS